MRGPFSNLLCQNKRRCKLYFAKCIGRLVCRRADFLCADLKFVDQFLFDANVSNWFTSSRCILLNDIQQSNVFTIIFSLYLICRSMFVIRRSSFVISRSSFVDRHSKSGIIITKLLSFQALKLPKSSPISKSNGKLINLLAFDTYRFDTMVSLLHHLWKGPIEVIVFGYILYNEIGFYSWIGIALIICFVPIQSTYTYKLHTIINTIDLAINRKFDFIWSMMEFSFEKQ